MVEVPFMDTEIATTMAVVETTLTRISPDAGFVHDNEMTPNAYL